jgi:hypothetical protein
LLWDVREMKHYLVFASGSWLAMRCERNEILPGPRYWWPGLLWDTQRYRAPVGFWVLNEWLFLLTGPQWSPPTNRNHSIKSQMTPSIDILYIEIIIKKLNTLFSRFCTQLTRDISRPLYVENFHISYSLTVDTFTYCLG